MQRFSASVQIAFLLALGGCGAIGKSTLGQSSKDSELVKFVDRVTGDSIVMNMPDMVVTYRKTAYPLEDCSDSEFFCFKAGGWFGFSFPKNCPADVEEYAQGWEVGGFQIRYRAPTPHRRFFSGLYFDPMGTTAPYVYDDEFGLVSIVFSELPPDHKDWGEPGMREARYSRGDLGDKKMSSLFKCSPPRKP